MQMPHSVNLKCRLGTRLFSGCLEKKFLPDYIRESFYLQCGSRLSTASVSAKVFTSGRTAWVRLENCFHIMCLYY